MTGPSGSDVVKTAALVAGTALAAGFAYSHLSKRSNGRPLVPVGSRYISIVIFADGGEGGALNGGRTIQHPRNGLPSDLIAAAGALFHFDTPR
jgi:hypothetical protein